MATKKQTAAAQVQPIEHADPKEEHEHVELTARDAVLDVAHAAAELCDACAYLTQNVSFSELTKLFNEELTAKEAFWLANVLNETDDALCRVKEDLTISIL